MPQADSINTSRVNPAFPVDYWELRLATNVPENFIIIKTSGGTLPRSQLSASVRAQLNALRPRGFRFVDIGSYFLAHVRGSEVAAITTGDGVRAFLGELETIEEVVLLLFAREYAWDPGFFRLAPGGWEVVVHEFDGCNLRDRVLLRIATDGTIVDMQREIAKPPEGIC